MTSTKQLTIRLFAGARDAVQSDSIQVEVVFPIRINELKAKIAEKYAALIPFIHNGRMAVANEFVADNDLLAKESETIIVALIPPVSGG